MSIDLTIKTVKVDPACPGSKETYQYSFMGIKRIEYTDEDQNLLVEAADGTIWYCNNEPITLTNWINTQPIAMNVYESFTAEFQGKQYDLNRQGEVKILVNNIMVEINLADLDEEPCDSSQS